MIECSNICKTYRIAWRDPGFGNAVKSLFMRDYETIRALDNVSFRIGAGEMVGYIGPNGAGKSSTMKIMSGILTPDSGSCTVNGRVHGRSGNVMSGTSTAWNRMLLGGICVSTAMYILYAGISCFTIEGLEFMNIFTHGGNEFGAYPMSIYGEAILKFFTWVVPIALFQYYPLQYLIGKSEQIWYMFFHC